MIPKWVICLCVGFAFVGLLAGQALGDISDFIIVIVTVGFPFILGIHTGIMHERNI